METLYQTFLGGLDDEYLIEFLSGALVEEKRCAEEVARLVRGGFDLGTATKDFDAAQSALEAIREEVRRREQEEN